MKRCIALMLLSFVLICAYAQVGQKVKGRVIDGDTKEALIGVTILLEGSQSVGTITHIEGTYQMSVPEARS